jgi:hypothetical protein
MPIIGNSTTLQVESIVFATDFSPASQNAGLYASALSIHFGTDLFGGPRIHTTAGIS